MNTEHRTPNMWQASAVGRSGFVGRSVFDVLLIFQMPSFSYKALQTDGKVAEGVLEASSRPEALKQMAALGLRPVNLKEKAAAAKKPRCRRAGPCRL
jgi:hypothetical protein